MQRISLISLVAFAAGCAPDVGSRGASGGSSGAIPDAGDTGGITGTGGTASGSGGAPGSGGATAGGSGGTAGTGGPTGTGGATGTGGSSGRGGSLGTGGATTGTGGRGGAVGTGGTPVSTGGQTGVHTNPLIQAQIDSFVTAHNQARSGTLNPPPSPALPPVTWDAVLADVAFNYLSKCVGAGGLVSHNANRTTDYAALGGSGYVGENIFATTANTTTGQEAVSNWMSEAPLFNYATGDFTTAGHYTQVVWRTSVRIGCAIVNCPALMFHDSVLCDYAPGGNITGQKPY